MTQSQVTPLKTAAAIVTFQGKILLLQRDHNPEIRDPGMWQLPGGGIEKGESPQEALQRELKEEIGIVPESVYFLGEPEPKVFVYHTPLTPEESMKVKKGDEGKDLAFFTLSEITTLPLTQKLKAALLAQKKLFESLIKGQ
jgi:8-oxo-dGTP pyrophosphatase MutT (NUDIX family)